MNELMTAPTTDEIIRNAQYHQAQRVVELLLSKGLITPAEYEKITDINRMIERENGTYETMLKLPWKQGGMRFRRDAEFLRAPSQNESLQKKHEYFIELLPGNPV